MLEILPLAAIVIALLALRSARENSRRMNEEIARLRTEMEALRTVPAIAPETVAEDAVPETETEPEELAGPWSRAASAEPAPVVDEPAGSEPDAPIPAAAAARENFESRIGARWAVWVGGIALALGGIFLVKYSIEAGLLSPAVRLSLAALFGLALMGAGEAVRRHAVPEALGRFRNAMVPGILTAAGVVTLFAVTYAAHAVYGYFGPVTTFVLLSLVSFATLGLSLVHGQALAGLGLFASLATPALVSTGEARPWPLFLFLAVVWLATLSASRLRRWQAVPALANAGLMLWALLYVGLSETVEPLPVLFALLVLAAGLALLWPGNAQEDAGQETAMPDAWERLLSPFAVAVSLTGALALFFPALAFAARVPGLDGAGLAFTLPVLALAALGAARGWAVYAAAFSAFGLAFGAVIIAALPGAAFLGGFGLLALPLTDDIVTVAPVPAGTAPTNLLLAASAAYAALGIAGAWLRGRQSRPFGALWSVLAPAAPFAVTALSLFVYGNLTFDLKHGLAALVFGLAFLAAAEVFSRGREEEEAAFVPQWAFAGGGFAFLVLALHALTEGLATTLCVAFIGALAVFATRLRRWPVLPWLMAGAAVVVAGRIAVEPSIVGAASLSKTPVFNQLLAGYGIPAALLALSAFELRRWPGERIKNLLQALASLFLLLTAAILVRHAMNGGVLDSSVPTLGEQAIYTLLVIGASAVMMTLDLKSPSPVFRYGSMAVGVVSVLSVASAHLIGLNPYFTGELLGRWPVLDLLLIGYLLPGLAYAGLARYARGRRPAPYVTMLALAGVVLAFAWVTLCVRRFWHGQSIADWKGFLQAETYAYSVVWLILGVLLLALGSKLDSRSIRLASAGLVLIAVVKVFLIDMSNLEGFLRALSFIGLGAVLIGIGLFYQKILSRKAAPEK